MENFKFEMSLSVLNHLGRNLYRNFMTVLGEAISNAWDADAENVKIHIDKDNKLMTIIDDGIGMNTDDFQHKFLRVGHTKRDEGNVSQKFKRPYIGRKGIGKLALLSCSEKVHIATKCIDEDILGGTIDNSNLDKKIAEGGEVGEYKLESLADEMKAKLAKYKSGTAIIFQEIKVNTINSPEHVKKTLALYFQFAMLDKNFNIFVNDEKITITDLQSLINSTQMVWNINSLENELVEKIENADDGVVLLKSKINSDFNGLKGFIATVEKPSSLKVSGLDGGQVTLDLFVNGRVRETDILKYFPTKRIVESYVYGQIHVNSLDEGDDIFTSSREGVIVSDSRFQNLIKEIEKLFRNIMDEWDVTRVNNREKGDPEGTAISKNERLPREMVQAILNEEFGFEKKKISKSQSKSKGKEKSNREIVEEWIDQSVVEAAYNNKNYVRYFIIENLLRWFIQQKGLELKVKKRNYREREKKSKLEAGIDYEIRQKTDDIFYNDIYDLIDVIATKEEKADKCGIILHARKLKPLRNAVAHTVLLTQPAKSDLELNFINFKERLIKKLDEFKEEDT